MSEPIIRIRHMHKHFPGVHALNDVQMDIFPGEVHALVGENGAGKSTLIKVIAGVYGYEEGEYLIEGKPAAIATPVDAIRAGVSVVYQELNVVEDLSVAENILYGALPRTKAGLVRWGEVYRQATDILHELGLEISPKIPLRHLSIAQKQLVEIGKAISRNARVIILDEPTSSLPPKEVDVLFRIIRQLRDKGMGIVYVSHKMEEIFAITDRVTVMRDGRWIQTSPTAELTEADIISAMVGRELTEMYSRSQVEKGEVVLEVSGVSNAKVHDASFYVRAGEIVGMSGLLGAGRSELARAVFGVDERTSGSVRLCGKELAPRDPVMSKRMGMGFMSEDRKLDGIISLMSVSENITIATLNRFARGGVLQHKVEMQAAEKQIASLRIKTPSPKQLISKLSGGNQQKCLLARWLINSDLKVLIIDEPTRGIDVGAKAEIYAILDELTRQGMAICMISSELPELMGMCDRVYTLSKGRITGEHLREDFSQERLMKYALL